MPRGICSHGTNDQVRNNAAVLFWAALFGAGCVFCATSARAEILYDRDGIQLQGTARIITYNAATCHVLKESLPESRYEELKAHDGQPLHVWQLDYSAYNGTGKGLSYLRADFDVESEYPPCSNWTGEGPGNSATGSERYSGPVQWGNQSRTLSAPAGMGSGEVKEGVLYLAVYHTHLPSFRRSSVHFTFGEPDKTTPPLTEKAAASPNESGPDRGQKVRTGSPSSFQNEPTCAGQPKGTACWMELANQPGCHVWNPNLQPDATATWTGKCAEALAQGTGMLKWVWDGGEKTSEGTGPLQEGKRQGQWVERWADGTVQEGPYVEGKAHGRWVERWSGGGVYEGPYVEGKAHGRWVERWSGGGVYEGPYVEGKKHGQWVERWADGTVQEGPYVEGKQHGQWVLRWAFGAVGEGPYVEGKQHGQWVTRWSDGSVDEGPYVEGKRHGQWVTRWSGSRVDEGPYVEGKRHGRWVLRWGAGSRVDEGPYVEGKKHGQWVGRRASGSVDEGPYVEGKKHGQWVGRRASGSVDEGPYVEGKKHGQWVGRRAGGDVNEGPYVEGKKHGQWVGRFRDGSTKVTIYNRGMRVDN